MNSCNSASQSEPTERYGRETADYLTFRAEMMENSLSVHTKMKENEDVVFFHSQMGLIVRFVKPMCS